MISMIYSVYNKNKGVLKMDMVDFVGGWAKWMAIAFIAIMMIIYISVILFGVLGHFIRFAAVMTIFVTGIYLILKLIGLIGKDSKLAEKDKVISELKSAYEKIKGN